MSPKMPIGHIIEFRRLTTLAIIPSLGVAQRFVMDGLEAALGRKKRESRPFFITGDIEARICAIACSQPPQGRSRWTMQMIADELIRLEVVETISDTAVCDVMKKTK